MGKIYMDTNVLYESKRRFEFIYEKFPPEEIWLSFSGGKDSTVCLELMIQEAKKRGIEFINVLTIDLEGHYKMHEEFLYRTFQRKDIKIQGFWVCLPLSLRNSSSCFQPKWLCWDPQSKKDWIRKLPSAECVVSLDNNIFDFFKIGIEFEDFIIEFPRWLKNYFGLEKVCQIIGIRTDESYHRYLKIKAEKNKEFFDGNNWILIHKKQKKFLDCYLTHPIYDWTVQDVWKYLYKKDYTKVYDKMYLLGYPYSEMRICQPYGEEQRKNIGLFSKIEPDTWIKLQKRVQGSNFAKKYNGKYLLGDRKIKKPEQFTWEIWTRILLNSFPKYLKEHYLKKINIFLKWWRKELYNDILHVYKQNENDKYDEDGLYIVKIPDEPTAEVKALYKTRRIPSWYRIAKTLIKNDYYCKELSFKQNKNEYEKLEKLKKKYGDINK
ncbi:MAG: DUF3440 domain-containing protein [Fusobacteriales bacterium]|nr:DUF3440 domain-containing protein [Fusobacteriales bacterium]